MTLVSHQEHIHDVEHHHDDTAEVPGGAAHKQVSVLHIHLPTVLDERCMCSRQIHDPMLQRVSIDAGYALAYIIYSLL
jgi:hypothetical protein